jgi:hypothetical protein
MKTLTRAAMALALSLFAWPLQAQTTGTISGLVTDTQGAALDSVCVRARNPETGFERSATSDRTGAYHLPGLPIGTYEITAELTGFRTFTAPATTLNVGRDLTLDVQMRLASRAENVTVSATAPLISTSSSAVGAVVDLARIEGLPLNGRQFANLAATVPGVGLGFHSDVSKTGQYTPQVSGGNGRNINYVVDGADNNDDTVGGLLQSFPLESIAEFSVLTHRFDAEYGRSNGALVNVVTKSGTNQLRGSWFALMRDDSLNARTFREKLAGEDKQPYRRYQYGGSVGGPLQRNRTHYFAAFERTQQDTKQIVNTLGVFSTEEGVFDIPFRQNLLTGKLTTTFGPRQHVSLRYARDHNRQLAGVTPTTAHSAWATSANRFDSVNVNHNWVAASSLFNEVVVQYANFVNDIPANSSGPTVFVQQSDVRGGTSAFAPQRTEQTKIHVRDDLSWTLGGRLGRSHEIRTGVSWVHEPRLRVFQGTFTQGWYTLRDLDLAGPIVSVQVAGGNSTTNFPFEHYGVYTQDDWRVTDRLTLNLGLRWDYTSGIPIDQSGSDNFQVIQEAARAGLLAGTFLDEFRQEPRGDRDNVQPRIGAVLDLFGNGRDVVRGGWGIYTDFGYIASNVLTAALDAGHAGTTFLAANNSGLRKLDGTFFRLGDPLSSINDLNVVPGGLSPAGEVASPVLEQPYSRQTNVGWSHQVASSTVITADYVRVDGRDLNVRLRPYVMINKQLLLAGVAPVVLSPQSTTFRTAVSKASSRYDGLILALHRRMSKGVDATASYTLSQATTDVGTASDEIVQSLMQDIHEPFGSVQQGPASRTDSRHLISLSGIVRAPWGLSVAPIFYYRSALPVHTSDGDVNGDGIPSDKTALAYRYTGITSSGQITFAEDGPCRTINCSRRAPFSQLNLRVSRSFSIRNGVRVEAIAETFNLFNRINPALSLIQRRGSTFMQSASYAGDVGQPEQRVGQIGFRITF